MTQVRLRRGRAFVIAAAVFVALFFCLSTTRKWRYGTDEKLARLQAYGNSFRHGIGDPSLLDWDPNVKKPHELESDTLVIPATAPQDHADGRLEVYDEDPEDYAGAKSHLDSPVPPSLAPIQEDAGSDTSVFNHFGDGSLKTVHPPAPIAAHPQPTSQSATSTAAAPSSLVDENGRLIAIEPTNTVSRVHWTSMKEHYPVPTQSLIHLPKGTPKMIPRIQHKFATESPQDKQDRQLKLDEIKSVMNRTWYAYREHAWGHDEIMPLQATQKVPGTQRVAYRDPFAGWGATLVDSLDTLWIMGMKKEFDEVGT